MQTKRRLRRLNKFGTIIFIIGSIGLVLTVIIGYLFGESMLFIMMPGVNLFLVAIGMTIRGCVQYLEGE